MIIQFTIHQIGDIIISESRLKSPLSLIVEQEAN